VDLPRGETIDSAVSDLLPRVLPLRLAGCPVQSLLLWYSGQPSTRRRMLRRCEPLIMQVDRVLLLVWQRRHQAPSIKHQVLDLNRHWPMMPLRSSVLHTTAALPVLETTDQRHGCATDPSTFWSSGQPGAKRTAARSAASWNKLTRAHHSRILAPRD
jgi:hypothetical protein